MLCYIVHTTIVGICSNMRSIDSILQQYAQHPVIHITDVPDDTDLSYWACDKTFLVHAYPTWDIHTFDQWIHMFTLHGLGKRPHTHELLNTLVSSFPLYQNSALSKRLSMALWLGIWSPTPYVWLHPLWTHAHPSLQTYINSLLSDDTLNIQWITCNLPSYPTHISWHDIVQ